MTNRPSTNPTDKLVCEGGSLPPCRRAALLRNKTAILDALAIAEIVTVEAEYEELPFGCLVHRAHAHGRAGRFSLPTLQIRYAEPGRRNRFRHRKLHLFAAFSKMLDDLLGDSLNPAIGPEGTLQIDVARSRFLLTDQSNGFQQQSFRRIY
ncbi:MAG: hypothetical protein EPN45_22700 [Rhizobiaceae bacterium]|nr:MAG: hypothetical protein EPN45_22700 [Rhizobiaceae bacterium]